MLFSKIKGLTETKTLTLLPGIQVHPFIYVAKAKVDARK